MFGIAAGIALKLTEKFPKLSMAAAHIVAWLGILAVAGLLVWAAIAWFGGKVETARDEGVEQGVTTERVEAQGKVIENVQTANETRAAVRDERSSAAYDECLWSARNPANCERFLPK